MLVREEGIHCSGREISVLPAIVHIAQAVFVAECGHALGVLPFEVGGNMGRVHHGAAELHIESVHKAEALLLLLMVNRGVGVPGLGGELAGCAPEQGVRGARHSVVAHEKLNTAHVVCAAGPFLGPM